ncbi:MAG: YlxR family protein [Chloroflexota bacterium]
MRRPGGSVELDPSGVAEGRGAYLCADGSCWRTALKRSALQRALGAPLPDALKTRLEHGDVAATGITADHGAPATITGGTHGS